MGIYNHIEKVLGLARRTTTIGDAVSVLKGRECALHLASKRKKQIVDNEMTWRFIGESSITGLMERQGEDAGFEREYVIH